MLMVQDHLNAYWDAQREAAQDEGMEDDLPGSNRDHRFVYIGMEGSRTPLHADVLRSFSWSANVSGRKLWVLLPPGEEAKLMDAKGEFMAQSLLFNFGESEFPHVRDISGAVVVEQGPGEAIFVPSGWWHEVVNLTASVSVNHNWLNLQCNAHRAWRHLQDTLSGILEELHDPDDQEDPVLHEELLERKSQMNMQEFVSCQASCSFNRIGSFLMSER